MKLGELKTFNINRGMTISAKAEGKKKNLPQKKTQEKKQEVKKAPVFTDVVKDKIIDISESSYLVVSASKVEGEDDTFVDVRMYRRTDKYNGPTKKGVRIHVEFLEDLIQSLTQLDSELDSLGI